MNSPNYNQVYRGGDQNRILPFNLVTQVIPEETEKAPPSYNSLFL